MITQIVAGDDAVFSAQLYKDAAAFAIDAGATIKATLVPLNHGTAYMSAVKLDNAAVGADWDNSLVVVAMADTDTVGITYQGHAYLEIQVDDAIKETWFGDVYIVMGQIP